MARALPRMGTMGTPRTLCPSASYRGSNPCLAWHNHAYRHLFSLVSAVVLPQMGEQGVERTTSTMKGDSGQQSRAVCAHPPHMPCSEHMRGGAYTPGRKNGRVKSWCDTPVRG